MNLRQRFIPHALAAGLSLTVSTGAPAYAESEFSTQTTAETAHSNRQIEHMYDVCEYHIDKSRKISNQLQSLFTHLERLHRMQTMDWTPRKSVAMTARSLLDEQIRSKKTVAAYAQTLRSDGQDIQTCKTDDVEITTVPGEFAALIERYDV